VRGLFAWSHIWLYLLANLAGGVAAAGAFRATEPREQLVPAPVGNGGRPARGRAVVGGAE
jgi:hypothetical protein